jgi:hypothetical protein
MQVSIPTAGTDPCPNPGGGNTCFNATIENVSFNTSTGVETITMHAGKTAATTMSQTAASITTTFSNQAPIVFRRSIPWTTTSLSTEELTGENSSSASWCSLTAGVKIQYELTVEFQGSEFSLGQCSGSGPGPSWVVPSKSIERFNSPFTFTIDSPNHFAFGNSVTVMGWAPTLVAGLTAGPARNWKFADWGKPLWTPELRIAPDIYGWCNTPGIYGDNAYSPTSGACASHYGHNGKRVIDDMLLTHLRLRN